MITYKEKARKFRIVSEPSEFYAAKIISAQNAADYCRQFFGDDIEIYESMFMVMLNQGSKTIGWVKISQGGITGTVCDPRIIMKYACESLATSIILCHNHPSGNLKPSRADEIMTERITQALKFMDVKVFDHIILTADGFLSFAEEGLL